jgi:hypothetical protein
MGKETIRTDDSKLLLNIFQFVGIREHYDVPLIDVLDKIYEI